MLSMGPEPNIYNNQGCQHRVSKSFRNFATDWPGTGGDSWVEALFSLFFWGYRIFCKIVNFFNFRVLAGGFVMRCAKIVVEKSAV